MRGRARAGRAGPALLPRPAASCIATGGIGGLYLPHDQPARQPSARAWRWPPAPARCWPTWSSCSSIRPRSTIGADPMPLVSEAVRGEGAMLVDETRRAFHGRTRPAPSSRRATSSRAPIWRHIAAGHRVFLDAREALGDGLRPSAFPAIAAHLPCGRHRSRRPADPGAPAAHYHMGGIAVDAARPQHGARALGLRRGRRAPACTAPTAWPATRCWRRRSARAGSPTSVAGAAPRRVRPPTSLALPPDAAMPSRCVAIMSRDGRRAAPCRRAARRGRRAAAAARSAGTGRRSRAQSG